MARRATCVCQAWPCRAAWRCRRMKGTRISGSWDYASGCDVATHFLGATLILDAETRQPAAYGYVLLDLPMYTIVDNWSVIGMQGTGSKRIVVAEQVIPAHRVQSFADPTMSVIVEQPGRKLHTNPLFHGPLIPLLLTEVASVAVGTARGALDGYDEMLRNKKSPLPPFLPAFEAAHYQHHFGQAQGLIDTAEAALLHLGGEYPKLGRRPWPEHRRGRKISAGIRQWSRTFWSWCWQAMDLMFRTSGASVARRGSLLAAPTGISR